MDEETMDEETMNEETMNEEKETTQGSEEMASEEEHRYNEFEDLANRLDRLEGLVTDVLARCDSIRDSIGNFVEIGAVVRDEDGDDAIDEALEALEDFTAIEDLDLTL